MVGSEGPETIQRIADGALAAHAMLAGMRLDIFSALRDGPRRSNDIAQTIDSDPEKTSLLLYALVVAGLLSEESGMFSNTRESGTYLVNTSPTFIGARQHSFTNSWENAFTTADSVKSGEPQSKIDFSKMSPDEMEDFLRGLHPQALASGRALIKKFDFSNFRNLVEIGAGTGGLTLVVAETNQQIKAVLADFPAVTSVAQKVVREANLSDRVGVLPVNAVDDSLGGPYDVAIMRAFIQVLDRDQAQKALLNIGDAIEPGGSVFAIGKILDDSRTSPVDAALFNLNFLNIYDGGQAYTQSEYREWLEAAGFHEFKVTLVPGQDSIVSARKRA